MIYFGTFDLRHIGAGTITLDTAGESSIAINLGTLTGENQYDENVTQFSHVLDSTWPGFDVTGSLLMPSLPERSLLAELTTRFRALATTATWPNPNTINITFDPSTARITFAYPDELAGITFSNTATRRLFGFSADFPGIAATATGDELPNYMIVATVPGASNATVIYEDDVPMVAAYSAAGQSYANARTNASPNRREWSQQYEPLVKTYRRHREDDMTYEELFELVRGALPFAVYDGFGDSAYTAYYLDEQSDSFHPVPATPGNADQFHIPFKTIAVGYHS